MVWGLCSRSLAVGGSAIFKSVEKIKEKGAKIAAHLLEASAEDLKYEEGNGQSKELINLLVLEKLLCCICAT